MNNFIKGQNTSMEFNKKLFRHGEKGLLLVHRTKALISSLRRDDSFSVMTGEMMRDS